MPAAPEPAVPEPVQRESSIPELARALTIYRSQIETIQEETRKPREDLEQKYVAALRQLEKDLRDRGDLRNVLVVRAEIDRFEKHPAAEIENIEAQPEMLRTYWTTLTTHRKRFEDEERTRITALTQRFLQHLTELKADLTRQDRIPDALAVEKEIAAVQMSPYLVPTLKIVVEAGGRPVAAAIEQTQGPAAVRGDDGMYRLEAGAEYEFAVSYADERPGRRWQPATLSLTADWRGEHTRKMTLQEQRDPTAGNVLGMPFVEVKSGEFKMGSVDGPANEQPVRTVRITRDFYIGKFEVTQREYQQLMGANPSQFKGDNLPVERVSWHDAVKFCEELTQKERAAGRLPRDLVYRLPTEAEWEYAARGGHQARETTYAGGNDPVAVAWHNVNSQGRTQPVGTRAANEMGLHDMSGNVWEWVHDFFQGNYAGLPEKDPSGSPTGSARVNRGGSWYSVASYCRVAYRISSTPSPAHRFLGFRVVLAPVP